MDVAKVHGNQCSGCGCKAIIRCIMKVVHEPTPGSRKRLVRLDKLCGRCLHCCDNDDKFKKLHKASLVDGAWVMKKVFRGCAAPSVLILQEQKKESPTSKAD